MHDGVRTGRSRSVAWQNDTVLPGGVMDLVTIKQSPSKGTLAEKHTKELEKFIKLEVRALAASLPLVRALHWHTGRRAPLSECW